MKKEYVTPMMVGERFAPNEYVAACGDSGTTYLFTCDAGGGKSGNVYLETNEVSGLQTKGQWIHTGFLDGYWQEADQPLGGYHACGEKHEADSQDSFLEGYYVPYDSSEVTSVIVWRGTHNDDVHCTTNLDMNSWETAKS